MERLPAGDVTFVLTDVEGSTVLWERHPNAMARAIERLAVLTRTVAGQQGGIVVKDTGDGALVVFADAGDALAAAVAFQQALGSEPWPNPIALRARVGVHAGPIEPSNGDYHGPVVNRCARVMDAGHGGQILTTDDVRARALDGHGWSLRDLGRHRLKSLEEPLRLYQVSAVGLPDGFGPLRTLDVVPNNLPIAGSPMVGRQAELAELADTLERTRLVTLTGAGGSGKTRLALQVAAEVSGRFDAGAWLVDLSTITAPALVPATVAAAMGVVERPDRSWLEALVAEIGESTVLCLLDNCEHLVDAVAATADHLLRACAGLRLLATSREPLAVPGELTIHLQPLPASEAEQLFVDRAAAAGGSVGDDDASRALVGQICQRLDGLPLAVELAAALVRALPPAEIASRLDDRFRLLTGGSRTSLPRQRTLEAAVAWSYGLLDDDGRHLFRSLAVFEGAFSLTDAERLATSAGLGVDDVVGGVVGLVDRSLVVPAPSYSAYRMLETLRAYGRDRLAEGGELDAIRSAHLTVVEDIAFRAFLEIDRGPGHAAALAVADLHLDDVRAALAWATVDAPDRAAIVAAMLHRVWVYRAFNEGRARYEELLADPRLGAASRQACLVALAELEDLASAHVEALDHVEAAVGLDGTPGQLVPPAMLSYMHGRCLGGVQRWSEAAAVFDVAIAGAAAEGMADVGAMAMQFAVAVCLRQGDVAEAETMARAGRQAAEAAGNLLTVAHCDEKLGIVAMLGGDGTAAASALAAALAVHEQHGNRLCTAHGLRHAAAALALVGDPSAAGAAMASSEAIVAELGRDIPWWELDDVEHLLPRPTMPASDDAQAVADAVQALRRASA